MMEFTVKIRIDTQNPEIAFKELMAGLRFNGFANYYIQEDWRLNNRPLDPFTVADVAASWAQRKQACSWRTTVGVPGFGEVRAFNQVTNGEANDS